MLFHGVSASFRRIFTVLLSLVLVIGSTLGSTSCVVVRKVHEWQARAAAEEAVRGFRLDLDHEVYHGIYAGASEHLQHGVTEEIYTKYLRTVHELMGNSSASRQVSAQAVTNPDGIFVSLKYNTQFSQGMGLELFQWTVRDGRPLLYAYYFDSSRLRHP